MQKINQEEYEFLKTLGRRWKWIARDKSFGLWAYLEKPGKNLNNWDVDNIHELVRLNNDQFQFIQWEDEEPYSISELIKEYEFGKILLAMAEEETVLEFESESEGTEVKGIEWLKEELNIIEEEGKKILDKYVDRGPTVYRFEERLHSVNVFRHLLDQLDEPEVLSQEWISEHTERNFFDFDGERTEVVLVDDLQNLLVPRQEEITHKKVEKYLLDRNIRVIDIDIYEKMQSDLAEFENKIVIEKPVIPQFVANYIKWFKNDFEHNLAADIDFIISLIQVSHKFSRREKIKNWISKSGNAQKLIDAYRWGCEVEEEQKYYVMNNENELLLSKNKDDEVITYSQYYPQVRKVLSDLSHYQLTEQEIKDYDERYLAFAVKIEELEE